MSKTCYTYRISVKNRQTIEIDKYNPQNQFLGRASGKFCYEENKQQIQALLQNALDNQLSEKKCRQLGETLFNSLFNSVLRQDFINFYEAHVIKEQQFIRIELDIDEQQMPEIAALPWEFMTLPEDANQGIIWLATNPHLVFSRRRVLWNPSQPIQLEKGEKLRIGLAISAPKDLDHIEYQEVQEYLENLAQKQPEHIELLDIVNPATGRAITSLLEQKPHIFHFIGHGRFENEEGEQVGQIALINAMQKANWYSANSFAGLFQTHRPGIIVLQSCEGAKMSNSEAFKGIAPKIVGQNIPVVIAMQYEIPNVFAGVFSSEFYERLAKGEPVDIAAQNGRNLIAVETQYKTRDFATPVIFMNVQNGYLFTPPKAVSDNLEGIPEELTPILKKKITDSVSPQNNLPSSNSVESSKTESTIKANLSIEFLPISESSPMLLGIAIDVSGSMQTSLQNQSGQEQNRLESVLDGIKNLAEFTQNKLEKYEDRTSSVGKLIKVFAYGFGFSNRAAQYGGVMDILTKWRISIPSFTSTANCKYIG
jgi:hypothetical protein